VLVEKVEESPFARHQSGKKLHARALLSVPYASRPTSYAVLNISDIDSNIAIEVEWGT
jgi:hypothetical protein